MQLMIANVILPTTYTVFRMILTCFGQINSKITLKNVFKKAFQNINFRNFFFPNFGVVLTFFSTFQVLMERIFQAKTKFKGNRVF